MTRRVRQRGFTLLELLVVMVIIGLLASLVAPRLFGQVDKSGASVAKAQIDAFTKALDTFRLDMGSYPSSEQGLKALVEKPAGAAKWSGPYLQRSSIPLDPWGAAYIYRSPGAEGRDYEVSSLGRDQRAGGEGVDADLKSW